MRRSIALVLVALLLAPASVVSAAAKTLVGGVVKDPSGAPQGKLTFQIVDVEKSKVFNVTTDDTGAFNVKLPAGSYKFASTAYSLKIQAEPAPELFEVSEGPAVSVALLALPSDVMAEPITLAAAGLGKLGAGLIAALGAGGTVAV